MTEPLMGNALQQFAALAKLMRECSDTFTPECDCRSRRGPRGAYDEFEALDERYAALVEQLADPANAPPTDRAIGLAVTLMAELQDLLHRYNIELQADRETDRAIRNASDELTRVVRNERQERNNGGRGVAVDFEPARQVLEEAGNLRGQRKYQQAIAKAGKIHTAIARCRGQHRYTVNRQEVEALVAAHQGVDFTDAMTMLARATTMLEQNDLVGGGDVARNAAKLARRKVAPPKPQDPRARRVLMVIEAAGETFGSPNGSPEDGPRLAEHVIGQMTSGPTGNGQPESP